jgi:hypothetical protein
MGSGDVKRESLAALYDRSNDPNLCLIEVPGGIFSLPAASAAVTKCEDGHH